MCNTSERGTNACIHEWLQEMATSPPTLNLVTKKKNAKYRLAVFWPRSWWKEHPKTRAGRSACLQEVLQASTSETLYLLSFLRDKCTGTLLPNSTMYQCQFTRYSVDLHRHKITEVSWKSAKNLGVGTLLRASFLGSPLHPNKRKDGDSGIESHVILRHNTNVCAV